MGVARHGSRAAARNGLGFGQRGFSEGSPGKRRTGAGFGSGRERPHQGTDQERKDAARNLHLFKDIAKDAFESRKAELKGDGVAGRWFSPLELHILPKLGKVPVSDIDQNDIRDVLSPIWHTKAETARKAMNRLGICLTHAAALGLEVDLQATEKARALLGKQRHKVQNVPAMAWRDVPAFYASLPKAASLTLPCAS